MAKKGKVKVSIKDHKQFELSESDKRKLSDLFAWEKASNQKNFILGVHSKYQ
jgi:hypothetical protein